MSKSELLTIGAFARATGLTASALRFYADSGLLRPATVDDASGYRYYARDQVERAVVLRRLREVDMPLERVAEVLAADPRDAARVVDDHVAALADRARRARDTATAVKAALGPVAPSPSARVNGLVFTAAVEQVLTATTHEPDLPVLNGVRVEVSADGVVLTATDRYRLSTRTLVPTRPTGARWSETVDADDLRLVLPWTRRERELLLSTRPGRLCLDGSTTRECRTLPGPFPDHRLLLASLPEVRTRVVVPRNALLRGLERQHHHRVRLDTSAPGDAVTVTSRGTATSVPAAVTGPAVAIEFALTTLHPAVNAAVGPDVMLDIAGPHEPVVVRSADDGDLTTLVMPVRTEEPPHQEGTTG
ncbi:DNA polymerase III subunit beta family protein [Saccharothrix syringae]|uniref:MerR family transcriptional regulator n=1 Tax=Saccharothrix syringae TaxID=103733 RepID=A0A5Q0H4E5_SACSY|nr:MerR family transcriptional regulator [Saccharothrix syringae]QFZ21101.1 MerR family transcriptional regulator [Saccharothrix syringae]